MQEKKIDISKEPVNLRSEGARLPTTSYRSVLPDDSKIEPFITKSAWSNHRTLDKIFAKARTKEDLSDGDVALLARLSIEFEVDRKLLSSEEIGPYNSQRVRQSRISFAIRAIDTGELEYHFNDADLSDALEYYSDRISVEQVKGIVESFPIRQRSLAQQSLSALTRYSTIDSFYDMIDEIKTEFPGKSLLVPGFDNQADIIRYLESKSPSHNPINFREVTSNLGYKQSVAILDTALVNILSQDPDLAKSFVDNKVELYLPVSLSGGISLYEQNIQNSADVETELKQRITKALKNLQERHSKPAFSTDEVLEETIKMSVDTTMERLAAINSDLLKLVRVSPAHTSGDFEQIAKQIAGPTGLESEAQVAKIMAALPLDREEKAIFRDYLIRNISIFDDSRLVKSLRQIKSMIDKVDGEPVFYVPQEAKSFGLILSLYLRSNNITEYSVLTTKNQIRDMSTEIRRGKRNPSNLIILDDFSGTGGSLFACYESARKYYDGQITIATIASAPQSIDLIPTNKVPFVPNFNGFYRLKKTDDNFTFFTSHIDHSLTYSPEMNVYDDKKKNFLVAALGSLGFGSIASAVILPYMTPNTNFSALEPFSLKYAGRAALHAVKNTAKEGKIRK